MDTKTLPRRSEVNKMPLKSNFLSLCKPLRNESSIIVFLLILLSNAILANIFKI